MKATDGQLGHWPWDTQAGTALQVTSFFHWATKAFLSNHVPRSRTGNKLWEKVPAVTSIEREGKGREEKETLFQILFEAGSPTLGH